jgi:hypothetical protein
MNFIINSQEIFKHLSVHNSINTRNKYHVPRPNANLSGFQKSTLYAGIKIFNSSPHGVTIFKNEEAKFRVV